MTILCIDLCCQSSTDPPKLWVCPCPAWLWAAWSWELEQSGKVGRMPCHRALCGCCLLALHFPSTKPQIWSWASPTETWHCSHQPAHSACPRAVVILSKAELWEKLSGLQPGRDALGTTRLGRTGLLLLCFAVDHQWAGGHGNSWAGGKMFFPGNHVIHVEYFFLARC